MGDSRLAFDIVARGGSSAAAEFEKVAAASDHAGNAMKKNSKISTDAAKASVALTKARSAESNALDKVQVAESKLSNARQTAKDRTSQVQAAEARLLQVRRDTSSSTSMIAAAESKLASARSASRNSTTQVLAGEKALSKARREAAAAGDVAQKASKDLSRTLDNEGKKTGMGAVKSVLHWFTGAGKDFEKAGTEAGQSVNAGLIGVLKTPVIGPALIGGAVAAVTAAAVPLGAVLAGGVVTGFGAGIGALGVVFAAKSAVIKSIWSKTAHNLGAQMRTISKPFESTLSAMAVVAQRTFAGLKPELAGAFKTLGPAVAGFGDQLGRAFQKLGPMLQPLAGAFKGVLGALGPALNDVFAKLSDGLTKLSGSISKSPAALADFARGVGGLIGDILNFLTTMNDANEAFRRWTGGVSGVTALMWVLRGAVAVVLSPIELLAKGLSAVGDGMNWLAGKLGIGTQVMDLFGASTTAEASSLAKAAAAHLAHANAAAHNNHVTHQANAAATMLAGTYDRQAAATQKAIDALNRYSDKLLSLSGAQTDYAQAVLDTTQAIKDNGKTHDLNTQKGINNQKQLDTFTQSIKAQRDAMLNANDGNLKAAQFAETGRVAYVKFAQQMKYSKAEATALAAEYIKIPPVKKVTLQANISDLQTKLAAAEAALKSPHLTATKRAKLTADIKSIEAGIATSKALIASLPQSRTAKLQAEKSDLEAKVKAAQALLANPNLTKERKARLTADIANARAGIATINGMLNGLPGSKTVAIRINTYKSLIETTINKGIVASGAGLPHKAAGGPVTKGQAYVVGEHRPELFVPNQSGTIIPKVPSMAVGSSIAAGMAAGLRGGAGDAVSAAGDVAMAVIAKAKDVLGIASPSKAFAQLGLWVNQGFSIGLRGSAKQVQSAMSSLMSKVLNISFNAADTKKAIEKTITSLNASLAAARGRIKPVTGNAKHQAAAERGNRQAEASIRSIQAKLKSAYTDLANVASIAARLGTTVKRNAIIAMLQRENVAMQKLANARAKVAGQLKAAQSRLANAIQVRNDFKKQITDAAISFNSITNIQPDANGQLTASGIIAQMTETLRKTQAFAANLARLKKSGLNSTTYQQIAEAGVEQGGSIADALLAGGGNTFNSINRLQSNISSAAAGLGDTASKNLYQAGVDAAQGLVNGLLAKTKALDAASKKLAAAIVAQIKKTLGIRSPSKVLEWHGRMAGQGFSRGIELEYGRVQKAAAGMGAAARPSGGSRRAGGSSDAFRGGEVITVPIQLTLDGRVIQQSLLKLKRTNGGIELGIA